MLGWQIELSSEIILKVILNQTFLIEIGIAKIPQIACQKWISEWSICKTKQIANSEKKLLPPLILVNLCLITLKKYFKKLRICKTPICNSLLSKLPKRDVNFQKYFLLVIKKYLGKQLTIEGLKLIIIIHDTWRVYQIKTNKANQENMEKLIKMPKTNNM